MSKFRTEFFIARRMSSGQNAGRGGVMTTIASVTVGIGIAVMIIAMAVIAGFRSQITSNLTGFGAHVQVLNSANGNGLETTPVLNDPLLVEQVEALPDCRGIYPFAVKGGIIKTDNAMQGVMLKGVDAAFDWSFFRENMLEGEVPAVGDTVRNKDILLSLTISRLMEIGVGDKIEMLFISEGHPPRRDRFRVCGVYQTGFDELDKMVVMTDMRNVQRLNGWDSSQITGYEALAASMKRMKPLESEIYAIALHRAAATDQSLMTVTIQQRFPGLFDWLQAHNVNAAVIITIMLLVALLNMISALLIILLERTQMIGTLKALGMTNFSLQKIFLSRSASIVLRGMVWGNIVGLGLCAVQLAWHPVKLDRAGYFLSEVPIELDWGWWCALNAGTFAIIVTLMVVPTLIVSFMKPDTTLRFR